MVIVPLTQSKLFLYSPEGFPLPLYDLAWRSSDAPLPRPRLAYVFCLLKFPPKKGLIVIFVTIVVAITFHSIRQWRI